MNETLILDIIPQGLFLINKLGVIAYSNSASLNILGVQSDEIKNQDICGSLFKWVDMSGQVLDKKTHPVMSTIQNNINIDKSLLGCSVPSRKDIVWIEANIKQVLNEDSGEDWHLLMIFSEVDKNHELSTLYKTIFDLSPLVNVLQDFETQKYIDVNQAFCEFSGLTKEKCIGKTPFELGAINLEKDLQIREHLLQNGELNQLEFNSIANGKEEFSFLWTKLIDFFQKKYAITTLQVITDFKKTEQKLKIADAKYKGLYEHMRDAFVLMNLDGEILETNAAFLRMTGTVKNEVIGKSFLDLTPLKWRELENNIIHHDVLINGFAAYEKEYKIEGQKVIPVEVTMSLEHDSIETDIGIWAIIVDISERKRVIDEINESKEQLRELAAYIQNIREEERINIAREIHDELGHILTILKLDLENILNYQVVEMDLLIKEISPLINLVSSAIDSVRKISTELRPGILDHFGLVPALQWLIENFKQRTKYTCHCYFETESQIFNKMESSAIFRIFQEILTNSARYSQATEMNISMVKLNDAFVFEIKDNGIGFDPDNLPRKTSLGILGMKERAYSIGADFSIKSKEGTGTAITISLVPNKK